MQIRVPVAAVAAVLAIAAVVAGCGGGKLPASAVATGAAHGGAAKASAAALPGHSTLARPGFSIVATALHGHVTLYRRPGGGPLLRVQRSPDPRFPLVLLVKQARPGWLEVRLPVRPNQSTAWIRQAEVAVRYDAYRLDIQLRSHRLTLWRGRRPLDRQRIAVGTAATPTPNGVYYVIQQFRLSDPGGPYGPYALGLSGYSNVLKSFGSGPGQIALHGTNDPGSIGSNVSHGCIHLSNPEITRLAHLLPLGTPVRILA
ncbi:MAG: L,D-transpeptidase [Solirubrobacteraceae bacterium]